MAKASHRVAVLVSFALLGAPAARADDCTGYSVQYSEERFARVTEGMTREEVAELVGPAHRADSSGTPESWWYGDPPMPQRPDPGGGFSAPMVFFEDGKVFRAWSADGVSPGMDRLAVERALGKPRWAEPDRRESTLHFSHPTSCATYAARIVRIGADQRVTSITRDDRAPVSAFEIRLPGEGR
jgi:outer membrane protein assembly factor BamE (lipoprotein component of BamABCDE complex)